MNTMDINVRPALLNPALHVEDPAAAYWLAQVTLRLRREISWCWYQRAGQINQSILPPHTDPVVENLDLTRYDGEKKQFFLTDVTANYLTQCLSEPRPAVNATLKRGTWDWIVNSLQLSEGAQFILALGLAARLDSSLGPIFCACLNDSSRPYPTLALAQRLWDDALEIVSCADPSHPLIKHGLLTIGRDAVSINDWYQPIEMHAFIAKSLVDTNRLLPNILEEADTKIEAVDEEQAQMYMMRFKSQPLQSMQAVPLLAPKDSNYPGYANYLSNKIGRRAVAITDNFEVERQNLIALAGLAWLRGFDLVVPPHWMIQHQHKKNEHWFDFIQGMPARWFVPVTDIGQCNELPAFALMPPFRIQALTYEQRLKILRQELGLHVIGLENEIAECARRFRFQEKMLTRVIETLKTTTGKIGPGRVLAACRTEAINELGHLAQPVEPRFAIKELVLPNMQTRQISEIIQAMRSLTHVHYGWGTAKAWNEGGLSVLFCGPPGTGKTMAAEALGEALKMPMYRIDLSQVVNKYIGETEKNLKKIFDASELSDCILFFDEADALFGKRTEVKDAHDRFANIEISYLLERMERFKGLAILATNRRKDLDEAFMRRLRYLIEFPMPGLKERELIWRQVFPERVDTSEIDFYYLAKQFSLSGGHIRSIAFNTCLQSADEENEQSAKITMPILLTAVKRELDKLDRSANDELFGRYAHVVRELI